MRWLAAALVLMVAACSGEQPGAAAPDPVTLLVPVYFYQGHTVGKANLTSGLQTSDDDGKTWQCRTWPELISNSVAVDASGTWLYLACGNGVMASCDAGQNWRLTGGWEMAEVQKVCIDRRDPKRAWVATAYGVFATSNVLGPGNAWRRLDPEGPVAFSTDVLQDAVDADTIWVAAHNGLFVSHDAGRTYEAVLSDAPVRRVAQDRENSARLWAATDGKGLQVTTDDGGSFEKIKGLPDVTFCVVQDPHDAGVIHVGSMEGLSVCRDGQWRTSRDGMPDGFSVYGILPHPGDADRIIVSGNNGLHESRDDGVTWTRLGFENALVPDLACARLADVAARPPSDAPGSLKFGPQWGSVPGRRESRDNSYKAFEKRRKDVLDYFRGLPPPKDRTWPGFVRGALTVRDAKASAEFWSELRDALETPKHSMFFSMPLMGFYLFGQHCIPEDIAERIRDVTVENPVYRGDTENHWVMHYTAQLLAAQTWPETPAAQWSTGRPTQEVYNDARAWLVHWAALTATKGQGEFDSPNYMFMYVTPMLLLHDFAKEPLVKRLARSMLDLLLADYLAESLQGAYCGGHSRIIGKEVELTTRNRVACYHHLYAGGIPMPEKIHGWALFAAMSSYRPPLVFTGIANHRGRAYVHTETKRVRNVIRFGAELNPPVHKTTFMTPLYAMGSLQGGILQPIQQHTWDVTWLGSAQNSTLFTVHPSMSGKELAMFFPEDIHDLTKTITAQKGVYSSPDKLISASPHERVFQHENVLLALYQVPKGEQFPHVTLYWPNCLERTQKRGWVFGRDGGFWLAYHASRDGVWTQHDSHWRLRCPGERLGLVVITRPAGERGLTKQTFEEFQDFVMRCEIPALTEKGDDLTLSFTDADGAVYGRIWGDDHGTIDGLATHDPSCPLFAGPFIRSSGDQGTITLSDGRPPLHGRSEILWFHNLVGEEKKR
jgi:hypothetical protein